MAPVSPSRPPWRHELPTLAAAGLVYLLVTLAAIQIEAETHPLASLRVGGAIMLGTLLRRGSGMALPYLLMTLVANLAANLASGREFDFSIGVAAVRMFELGLAYFGIRALRIDPIGLRDVRALAYTGLIAVGMVPAIGGAFGGLLLQQSYGLPLAEGITNWALGSAMGMLIGLPVLLAYTPARLARLLQRRRLLEFVVLTAVALLTTLLAIRYTSRPFVVMSLPLMLASLRLGLLGTTLTCASDIVMVAFLRGSWLHARGPEQALGYLQQLDYTEVNVYSALSVLGPLLISVILVDRSRTSYQLAETQLRLQTVTDHVPALIGYLDAGGRYRFVNRVYEDWLGIPAAQFIGKTPADMFGVEAGRDFAPHIEQAMRGIAVRFERVLPNDRHAETSIVPHVHGGQVRGLFLLSSDISDRKALEAALRVENERVQALAGRDHLTGLPNRRSFELRLAQALESCERDGQLLGLLFLDLDGFKPINDTHGHEVGDRLLQEVATRLSENMRGADLVSRLGGDEFVTVLVPIRAPEDAVRVAEKLLHAIRQPFDIEGHLLQLSLSIGVAVYPVDGTDAASLLKHADAAMYQAKQRGNAQCWQLPGIGTTGGDGAG